MFVTMKNLLWKIRIRYKIIFLLVMLPMLMIIANITNVVRDVQRCFLYRMSNTKAGLFEDILMAKKKPKNGKNIFFHETSCSRDNDLLHLTAREACAIESAALLNPHFEIFVLFAAPGQLVPHSNSTSAEILNAVLSYPNVNFRSVNLWTYAAGTPVYEWLKDGKLFESQYVLSHTSDFLRYLTLWRWGGTYLDLDVIVKQSLEKIKPNFAGAESKNFVAAGVMNFHHKGLGHQIADLCLQDFQINFNGNDWGHNGPGVITRVLQTVCKTTSPQLMSRDRCLGFKVFPIESFYAISWWNWSYFFDPQRFDDTLKMTNNSIVIHVWNKNSNSRSVQVGSKVAYAHFAEKYCPKVYKSCGKQF